MNYIRVHPLKPYRSILTSKIKSIRIGSSNGTKTLKSLLVGLINYLTSKMENRHSEFYAYANLSDADKLFINDLSIYTGLPVSDLSDMYFPFQKMLHLCLVRGEQVSVFKECVTHMKMIGKSPDVINRVMYAIGMSFSRNEVCRETKMDLSEGIPGVSKVMESVRTIDPSIYFPILSNKLRVINEEMSPAWRGTILYAIQRLSTTEVMVLVLIMLFVLLFLSLILPHK